MVPILLNKDVFEPSYNGLKFVAETAVTFVPTRQLDMALAACNSSLNDLEVYYSSLQQFEGVVNPPFLGCVLVCMVQNGLSSPSFSRQG